MLVYMLFSMSLLAGQILLTAALIGRRVGTTPSCGRCGYNLEGLEDADRCPECDTWVQDPAYRRIGRRVRSRRLALAGLGAWGVSALVLGAMWWTTRPSYNQYGWMPGWLLVRQSPWNRESADDFGMEVSRRLSRGELNGQERASLARRAGAMVTGHAWEPMSSANGVPIRWASIHARLWNLGEVSDDKFLEGLQASTQARAVLERRVGGPEELYVRVILNSANLNNLGWNRIQHPWIFTVNGEARGQYSSITHDWPRGSQHVRDFWVDRESVVKPLSVVLPFRVLDGQASETTLAWLVVEVEIPGFDLQTDQPLGPATVRLRLADNDPTLDAVNEANRRRGTPSGVP